jgi:hypothetical protein
MARGDQFPGEQARSATKLEHQPPPGRSRSEQLQDPGSALGGMEPEAAVMHDRKIVPVDGFWRVHG